MNKSDWFSVLDYADKIVNTYPNLDYKTHESKGLYSLTFMLVDSKGIVFQEHTTKISDNASELIQQSDIAVMALL